MRLTPPLAVVGLLALCAQTAAAQNPSEAATYRSLELHEGFLPDPVTVSLTAGGAIQVRAGACIYGFVAFAPDVDFSTAGGHDLYVFAQGTEDTILLINTLDDTWICNDDGLGDGSNPLVALRAMVPGRYRIWVGTFNDDYTGATLIISSNDPRGLREPYAGPLTGLRGLDLPVPDRRVRYERDHQFTRHFGHTLDRLLEGDFVHTGRLVVPAHLAHVLQCRRPNLLVRRDRIEIEERPNISAHVVLLPLETKETPEAY